MECGKEKKGNKDSPGVSKEMAAFCEQQGNHYLDADLSGSCCDSNCQG
jgi:hypothetical protein